MNAREPWSVLGVARDASHEEARRAYVLRSQLLHPDHHQGGGPDVVAEAERSMRELNEAWEEFQRLPEAPPPLPALPAVDVDACVRWVIDRMVASAQRHGDPLSEAEIDRLLAPASPMIDRRTAKWLQRRGRTLSQAIRDDRQIGAAWARALRTVDDASDATLGLLLHRSP